MISIPSAKTGWKAKTTSGTGSIRSGSRAFTLVEIVIAITVLSILGSLAVPAIESVQRERLAREPVSRLLLLAREVRVRAMTEERPYQILLDSEGFRATRFYHPYGGREDSETIRLELERMAQRDEIIEASKVRGISLDPAAAAGGGTATSPDPRRTMIEEGLRYFQEYTFPEGVRVSVRFWNDTEWLSLEGSEYRRWIFQPSGMCEPMRVRVEADESFFEIEFHPLTADVKSERSWVK